MGRKSVPTECVPPACLNPEEQHTLLLDVQLSMFLSDSIFARVKTPD